MANQLKTVFIDYASKLQSYLDAIQEGVFDVQAGKDIDAVDSDKVYVRVSYLQGTSNKDSVSLPVMIKIYCATELQETVLGTFIGLSKAKAQSSYTQEIETEEGVVEDATIFEQINTPAVLNDDVEFGTNNHWTEYVCFANLLVLIGIGNVKNIKIDGEEIEFLLGSINYVAEPISNRISGESLNVQKVKAASTSLQITLVNKTGVFTNKLIGMAFGTVSKTTIFNVDLELTNGIKIENANFIVTQSNLNFNKQNPTLPSYNVILTLADTRI